VNCDVQEQIPKIPCTWEKWTKCEQFCHYCSHRPHICKDIQEQESEQEKERNKNEQAGQIITKTEMQDKN
jgi:hypothetical protein